MSKNRGSDSCRRNVSADLFATAHARDEGKRVGAGEEVGDERRGRRGGAESKREEEEREAGDQEEAGSEGGTKEGEVKGWDSRKSPGKRDHNGVLPLLNVSRHSLVSLGVELLRGNPPLASMTEVVRISEEAGKDYGMVELLKKWKLPDQYHSKMSERWRCKIAPTARSEEEIKQHLLDGSPVLVDPRYGKAACDQVGGDCLDFLVNDETRNKFPRPKIAFVAGWGRPGSDPGSWEFRVS